MAIQLIGLGQLRLDELNPRHDPVTGERELMAAVMETDGAKTLRLAEDIAEFGMSPIDVALVMANGDGSYTVLEGNRRLTALKLLDDPSLAPDKTYEGEFRKLQTTRKIATSQLLCFEVADRDEAKHWLELRHSGEAQGRSVVRWGADASARFFGKPGTQAGTAVKVMDALKAAYPANTRLAADLDVVAKKRLTTFGRLVGDRQVRTMLGIDIQDPSKSSTLTGDELEAIWTKIAADLAGTLTVANIDKTQEREDYVRALLPARVTPPARPATGPASASPVAPQPTVSVGPAPAAGPAQTPAHAPAVPVGPGPKLPVQPVPKFLFEGVVLTKLDPRTRNILRELQQLDVEKFPNACAALTRVLIELAVFEVVAANGWAGQSLRDKVKSAVYQIDRTSQDPRYESVRVGLNDGTSMFAVATIQAWLHNKHFNPVPSEVRANAANYKDFLVALDGIL